MKHVFIKNVRSIDDLEIDISGNITIIAGQNGTGKTTATDCIEHCLAMKGFEKEAIQNGKDDLQVVYINQNNGEKQQVNITRTQDASIVSMTVTDAMGKVRSVKEVGEARKILGNYINFTPQDLVTMTQTAEGRRKFLMDVLFKSLDNETKARLSLLENQISSKKNQNTQGNLYQQRTTLQTQISTYEKSLFTLPDPTEEQLQYLENLDVMISRREELVKKMDELKDDDRILSGFISYFEGVLPRLKQPRAEYITKMAEILGKIPYNTPAIDELIQKIEKANEIIGSVHVIRSNKDIKDKALKALKDARIELESIAKRITDIKEDIQTIYRNADLPGNITITTDDDDDLDFLVSNGKQIVSISQLSESQLHYVIIVILMHISTAEMVNIGNIDIYDSKTLEKIVSLAKENNRILLAEQVTESEDLQIEILK